MTVHASEIDEIDFRKKSFGLLNASFCSLFELATCKREGENEK